jgi:AbiV family abortive infection protein
VQAVSGNKLDQYVGTLNAGQVAAGMTAAAKNSRRLAEDAALLLEHKRFPSAAALAVLSIEESGKLAILRRLASADSPEAAKPIWREYRSHTKKNVMGALLDLCAAGARRLDEFAPLFDAAADHPQLLDQVKQVSFYSDCLGKTHWSEPEALIDERLARGMVTAARVLARGEEFTELEIELWVKHVAPHLHGPRELAEKALEVWYAEMQRHDLAPAGKNAMSRFINEGVGGSNEEDSD